MNLWIAPLVLCLSQAPPAPAKNAAEAPPAPGPVVVVETSLGTFRIALDKNKAPVSVDNFLKYVKSGHYDGTVFHRVIPDFMIQGGGFTPDMTQRPTRPAIQNEASNGVRNKRGTLAMARTADPNSATAQFFVNLKDNGFLDHQPGRGPQGAGYAVFGEVIEGMDVVDKIAQVPRGRRGPHDDVPKEPVVLKKVRLAP